MPRSVKTLAGWARTAPSRATVLTGDDVASTPAWRTRSRGRPRGVIARGLGRSYGDAAQNAGGLVLDMTAPRRIHASTPRPGDRPSSRGPARPLIRIALPFGL